MKFKELNSECKYNAINEYQIGWLETHDEVLSPDVIEEILNDTNDECEYDEFGSFIGEA